MQHTKHSGAKANCGTLKGVYHRASLEAEGRMMNTNTEEAIEKERQRETARSIHRQINKMPLAVEIERDIKERNENDSAIDRLMDANARLKAELDEERKLRAEIAEDLKRISEMFDNLTK